MKKLEEILERVELVKLIGELDTVVSDLHIDSRKCGQKNLFFALPGSNLDGHDYIDQAIENGASVVVCQTVPSVLNGKVCYVLVRDVRKAMSVIAGNFFSYPDKKLKLIGITGTNGKTTIATLLYRLARSLGYKSGLVSTIEYRIEDQIFASTHTTPDVISLMRLFSKMVDEGCSYAFMEVSSHAIDQGRIEGLDFDLAVFSNISRDHLDYHETFKNYINVKKKFFDNLKTEAFALTNLDDANGRIMVQNTGANVRSYSFNTLADFKGKILNVSLDGLDLKFNEKEVHCRLTGRFNAYNLLAVYATGILLGWDEDETLIELSALGPVEGRFEIYYNPGTDNHAVIDYAHTPDALNNLLSSIDKVKSKAQRLITVIGAGGNRDKGKRPEMGAIGSKWSDLVIVTSDNPRKEDPGEIINDILAGIDEKDKKKVLNITDRREAIRTAILMARKGDVIVIAGKGHENYQIIGEQKLYFSDKEEVLGLWGM